MRTRHCDDSVCYMWPCMYVDTIGRYDVYCLWPLSHRNRACIDVQLTSVRLSALALKSMVS